MALAHSNLHSSEKVQRKISLRPREKAAQFGISNLSTAELVALILGSGTKKQSVFALSQKLAPLVTTDRLSEVGTARICIGKTQLLKLQAARELATRMSAHQNPIIFSPRDIWHSCAELRHYTQEYVVALYLDGRHRLLKKQTLAVGGHNFALLEPITLLHQAFTLPSALCALVHNHPSGDPQPSNDDLTVTARLQAACELMGIQLLDHLIIGKNNFISLREQGILPSNY